MDATPAHDPIAPTPDWGELVSWRRKVSELYATVRRTSDPADTVRRFRAERDELFRSHPQSALPAAARPNFRGLPYFPYDPAYRVEGTVAADVPTETFEVELGTDGTLRYSRVAVAGFRLLGQPQRLMVYWIEGYGGGLFIPFRDTTSGHTTYAGGRYLYDTIKGADLGGDDRKLILDFNYAYNPSCAYNPRWVCPLAPRENTLTVAVEAGEKAY